MFKRVLIANRGAVAVRIRRTLARLGVESVVVYADDDLTSTHVDGADVAVGLGAGPARDTYLDAERIVAAAQAHGCDAVHPGYGFLSENPGFARVLDSRGICFLGPTAHQIEQFGLKHTARELAAAADVPLLPGSEPLADADAALAAAAQIGYPVILKSTAGGGGIGMRACRDAAELAAGFSATTALAEGNFGDGRVFVERLVERARHVEVQVFGDGQGDVVVLGDRDCSLQRRHQKVIEEAPAPGLPAAVRSTMHAAARRLMASVAYRSAGTVEFLFDAERGQVYFLEVNTRLQVEHGVTELVTGVDIVEWMLRLGAGERGFLTTPDSRGHAIQARIYAEDASRGFRPSAGTLSAVVLPVGADGIRVDTWIAPGVEVPASFDPLLVKLLAHGEDREAARQRLLAALAEVVIDGVTTNTGFVAAALQLPAFERVDHDTATLAGLQISERSLEVVSGGTQTTVQDLPGRVGYWHVGVPPSGPMDTRALRRANALVGNSSGVAGLEMLGYGPALRFACDTQVAVCGAAAELTLDGKPVPCDQAIVVVAGSELQVGRIGADGQGLRACLAVEGGLDVPAVMGSASTFTLGRFGGHCGRTLRSGDVIAIGTIQADAAPDAPEAPPAPGEHLTLRVAPGPHVDPDFFTAKFMEQLYGSEWEVHYNSSRTGVRLVGPRPEWPRSDGGDAGLHPSNIHDNAYAWGAIDFTGDMPVILGPDGPSLGGFVCPAAVIREDLWKLGQLRPGERIRLASVLATPGKPRVRWRQANDTVVLATDSQSGLVVRAAGDQFVLIELGEPELDIRTRLRVELLRERLLARVGDMPGIAELTAGVRSLQLRMDPDASRSTLLDGIARALAEVDASPDPAVPSRVVHLPLAWDDPDTQEATRRYEQSVRADAPWCPRNIEFIRRINGLPDEQAVRDVVFGADYLVLGLGDVYLGAPVATPVDPRHRLVTTKYNPARTWTPENAVGIGGAYLCVYGMEGPGGYQFVGRTVQVWNTHRRTREFAQPWLLRCFDRLRFVEVDYDELLRMRRDFPLGRMQLQIEDGTFSLAEHEAFLASNTESIAAFRGRQQQAFAAERDRWQAAGIDAAEWVEPPVQAAAEVTVDPAAAVESPVGGAVWRVDCCSGNTVRRGDVLLVIESMKTEIEVLAHRDGTVRQLLVAQGDRVSAGQPLAEVA